MLGILTLLGQPRSAYAGWQQQSGEWKYEQAGSLVQESWIKEQDQQSQEKGKAPREGEIGEIPEIHIEIGKPEGD